MNRRGDTPIDGAKNDFLIEFLKPDGLACAICPIGVQGVDESPNGVFVRCGRGNVADQYIVRGPWRDVVDRLRAGWQQCENSILAHFFAGQLSDLEDRIHAKVLAAVDPSKLIAAARVEVSAQVREEIKRLAEPEGPRSPAKAPALKGSK